MRILFLTRFDQQGASSRMRFMQYHPWFDEAAIQCVVSPLFDDGMLLRKCWHGGYSALTLLSAFPAALYFILQKQILAAGMAKPIVKLGAYMSILALPMILVSSTGTNRISLYFSFIQMWIYPALIHTFKKSREVWIFLSIGVTLSIFLGHFMFGKYSYAYIPYQNLISGQFAWW